MVVRLKNEIGMVKEAKVGFSFTTLFFGLFVPLLRGDLKNSCIMAIVGLLTCGISWFVFPFFYNKTYLNSLLMQGFKGATDMDNEILISKSFIIREEPKKVDKVEEVKIEEPIKVEAIENKIDEIKEEAKED